MRHVGQLTVEDGRKKTGKTLRAMCIIYIYICMLWGQVLAQCLPF